MDVRVRSSCGCSFAAPHCGRVGRWARHIRNGALGVAVAAVTLSALYEAPRTPSVSTACTPAATTTAAAAPGTEPQIPCVPPAPSR